MKQVNVLLVEDEYSIDPILTAQIDAIDKDDPWLRVVPVRTRSEGEKAAATNFFHAALIDLNLEGPDSANTDGLVLIRNLGLARPSCKCVVITGMPQAAVADHRGLFLGVLQDLMRPKCMFPDRPAVDFSSGTEADPLHPNVYGIVSKSPHLTTAELIRRIAAVERHNVSAVSGFEQVLCYFPKEQTLESSVQSDQSPITTLDEIEYILSRLFGQCDFGLASSGGPLLEKFELAVEANEGKSGAVVGWSQPVFSGGHKGIYCVIKIARKVESLREARGYNQFVRLQVSTNRRVEMLAHKMGDTIGAVMYTFAGDIPGRANSLSHLIDPPLVQHGRSVSATKIKKLQSRGLRAITELFDPEQKEWYAREEASLDTLGSFFIRKYNILESYVEAQLRGLSSILRNVDRSWGLQDSDSGFEVFSVGRFTLTIPKRWFHASGSAGFQESYCACIVHGDMNAGNIYVGDNGAVTWIDFGETCIGPRSLDFATLQSSIRLGAGRCHFRPKEDFADPALWLTHIEEEIGNLLNLERLTLNSVWAASPGTPSNVGSRASGVSSSTARAENLAYWVRADREVWEMVRRNFDRDYGADLKPETPNITGREHAAVSYLWAVRVFKAMWPSWDQRLRMLIWMTALDEVLFPLVSSQ